VEPKPPPPRIATIRQRLLAELSQGPATARGLSAKVGIAEKEVAGHLEHWVRSLKEGGGRLVVSPAQCQSCGFKFAQRSRLSRPTRCPECRGTHLEAQTFQVLTP
jgi:predicted Zn-ribbon and HTH transcriptional regulator